MDVAHYIHLGTVIDPAMPIAIGLLDVLSIAQSLDATIGAPIVGVDHAFREDVFAHHPEQSRAICTFGHLGHGAAFALHNPHDGSFLFVATHGTSSSMLAYAAIIHFIHLNR